MLRMEINDEMKDYINRAVDVVDDCKDRTDWKTAKNIIQAFVNKQDKRFTTNKPIQTRLKQL